MAVKGFPVVLVEQGGTPFVLVEGNAPLATVAENGLGVPITPVASNAPPLVLTNVTPPIPPGPLDLILPESGSLNSFSHEFGLASDCAVVGIAAVYTGTPVVTITHGGEPFEIVKQVGFNGVMSILAVGTGLTTEVSDLEITVTGGSLGGAALRINEMANIDPGQLTNWDDEKTGQYAGSSFAITQDASDGKTVKGVWALKLVDRYLVTDVQGQIASVYKGSTPTGTRVPMPIPDAGWELSGGWAFDGTTLKHTGATQDVAYYTFPATVPSSSIGTGATIYAKVAADAKLGLAKFPGSGFEVHNGPLEGWICNGYKDQTVRIGLQATGDVEVEQADLYTDGPPLSWLMYTGAGTIGAKQVFYTIYQPQYAVATAEINGDNF